MDDLGRVKPLLRLYAELWEASNGEVKSEWRAKDQMKE